MATISDLEEEQLKQHLIDGGFLAPFTDIYGDAQPAPIIQMLEMDMTNVEKSDRVVMIKNIGGVNNPQTNVLFTQRNMLVLVVGRGDANDSVIAKGLARDMEQWLKANITDDECLFNIVSNGVSGPFIFEDSRRVYEINLLVSFNINRPSF